MTTEKHIQRQRHQQKLQTNVPETLNFERSREHYRHAILLMFDARKTIKQAHRFLNEVYGDASPSYSNCKFWYKRFQSGDFDLKDKERSGQPRKFTDQDLEALLEVNPSRTLKELSEELHVSKTAISERLHALGKIQKGTVWFPKSSNKKRKTN